MRDIHVELLDHRPIAVRRLGDGRLDIGGKQRQEFFLHRVLVRPVLEADQHPAGVAEILDHVIPHVITDLPGIPVRVAQQPLHPFRKQPRLP